MKRIVLIAATAFAAHAALAADAAPKAAASAAASASADFTATTRADISPADRAKIEAARGELSEMREQMRELSRKMAELSNQVGEGGPRSYAFRYIGDPDRAMIGVVLGMEDEHVTVGAMTPDGPAARAGLRGSDVLIAIDHQPIAAKTTLESVQKANSLLGNLKEGQKVTIDYLRDGKKGSVTLAAERREAWSWPQLMNEDPEHPFLPKNFDRRIQAEVERAQREAERASSAQVRKAIETARRETQKAARSGRMFLSMPWWGLNLAPLNAELGHYFGTDKGVLVIAADEGSLPGIRGGDVITSIAGEPVGRPEDALRALRDQPSGKDVPIKLLRDRKTLALNMKAPEFNSIFNLHMPPPPEPPTPPEPAAPPSARVPAPPAAPPAPAAPPTPPVPDDARS